MLRRSLFLFFLTASTAGLATGYAMIDNWPAAGIGVLPGLALLFHYKSPWWLPSAFLSIMVFLAVVGVFLGAPAVPMILGSALALGAWDLASLERSMKDSEYTQAARRFERKRARALALALGLGLALAVGGLALSLRVPFIVMFLFVILDLFCLDRVARYLTKRSG
jgi:hypothetical protein